MTSFGQLLRAMNMPRDGAPFGADLVAQGLGPFAVVVGGMVLARLWPETLARLQALDAARGVA